MPPLVCPGHLHVPGVELPPNMLLGACITCASAAAKVSKLRQYGKRADGRTCAVLCGPHWQAASMCRSGCQCWGLWSGTPGEWPCPASDGKEHSQHSQKVTAGQRSLAISLPLLAMHRNSRAVVMLVYLRTRDCSICQTIRAAGQGLLLA